MADGDVVPAAGGATGGDLNAEIAALQQELALEKA